MSTLHYAECSLYVLVSSTEVKTSSEASLIAVSTFLAFASMKIFSKCSAVDSTEFGL